MGRENRLLSAFSGRPFISAGFSLKQLTICFLFSEFLKFRLIVLFFARLTMGESVVDQLDGPAREKEEEKIAGRRPGLWLSSVVIRVLLLLSLPDLGGSSSTNNRLPNLRELIPIKASYKSSPNQLTHPPPVLPP